MGEKISLRLSQKQLRKLNEIQLDSLFVPQNSMKPASLGDLMGGLFNHSFWYMEDNLEFSKDIVNYLSFIKKLPRIDIEQKESKPKSGYSEFMPNIGRLVGQTEQLSGTETLQERTVEDQSISFMMDSYVLESAQTYFSELYKSPLIISNGEIAKMLIYFLTNDIAFQFAFRTYMFLGSLYGFSYIDTAYFLKQKFSKIDPELIINFRKWILKDKEKWEILPNLIDDTYKSKKLPKSVEVILPREMSANGEFDIIEASGHYLVLSILVSNTSQSMSYIDKIKYATLIYNSMITEPRKQDPKILTVLSGNLRRDIEILSLISKISSSSNPSV